MLMWNLLMLVVVQVICLIQLFVLLRQQIGERFLRHLARKLGRLWRSSRLTISLSYWISRVLLPTSAIFIGPKWSGLFYFTLGMIKHSLIPIGVNLFWRHFQLLHIFTARWELLMSLMLCTLTAILKARNLNLFHKLTLWLIPRSTAGLLNLLLETLWRLSYRGDSSITSMLFLLLEFHKLFLGVLKLFKHGAEGFHDFFVYFQHMVLANVSGVGAIHIAYLNLCMYWLNSFND